MFPILQEEELKMATQMRKAPLPVRQRYKKEKARVPTKEEKKFKAWQTLKQARDKKRKFGLKQKRAAEKAEAEK